MLGFLISKLDKGRLESEEEKEQVKVEGGEGGRREGG